MSSPDYEQQHNTQQNRREPKDESQAALVAQIRESTCCVDRATSAICANDLVLLEEICREQQILCAELGNTVRALMRHGSSEGSQAFRAEIVKAAHRNHRFLLLLQRVTLHAQSLQRLHQTDTEERWTANVLSDRSMKGRYV